MKLSDGAVQPAVIATDGSLSLHDRLKTNVFTYAVPALDRVLRLEHKKKKKKARLNVRKPCLPEPVEMLLFCFFPPFAAK